VYSCSPLTTLDNRVISLVSWCCCTAVPAGHWPFILLLASWMRGGWIALELSLHLRSGANRVGNVDQHQRQNGHVSLPQSVELMSFGLYVGCKAVDPAAEQWPATQGVEARIIHALARQPAADQRQANRSGGGLGHPRAGVAVECEWQSQAASL
jgi:hypothetical protein